MKSKNILLAFAGIIVCIFVFGLFVYPGTYHYDKYKNYPIKTNRFTGETEIFKGKGWIKVQGDKEIETSPTQ